MTAPYLGSPSGQFNWKCMESTGSVQSPPHQIAPSNESRRSRSAGSLSPNVKLLSVAWKGWLFQLRSIAVPDKWFEFQTAFVGVQPAVSASRSGSIRALNRAAKATITWVGMPCRS